MLYCISKVRLSDTVRIHRLESLCKLLVILKLCDNHIKRWRCHLNRIHRRTGCLCGKSCGTSVPELNEIIHRIEYGRSIYASHKVIYAMRILMVVDSGSSQVMA